MVYKISDKALTKVFYVPNNCASRKRNYLSEIVVRLWIKKL